VRLFILPIDVKTFGLVYRLAAPTLLMQIMSINGAGDCNRTGLGVVSPACCAVGFS